MSIYPALRYSEVVSALKKHGITCRQGKGSEIVLEGRHKVTGQYLVKKFGKHGKNPQFTEGKIKTIVRFFGIEYADFWREYLN